MYCGLQSTGNFTVQNLEDHLLSKFWKLCELLFGLVQHKCCNCSQRKDRTRDPHQVFLEHQHVEHQHLFSWVSVQHWSDQKVSPIKLLILSFCKPILFIRHEWGRVVSILLYRMQWQFLPCPWELQCFSINFVFDIFLSPLRHLKLCQTWRSVFSILNLTAVGLHDSFYNTVWRGGVIIYAEVLNMCIIMRF